jgi:hypothetical protein
MNKKVFFQLFGWYGAIAIVGAYYMASFGILDVQSISYQLLNITGALWIVIISYIKWAYQPMTLNLIWLIIGLIALTKLFF